ncbi:MAG: FemAB family PEP-CTERM system-associated protein [Planctomycetes bacterium]|nr:FemAB family PEP-CTERM system-associated protein [Planctomycetota bacterium]
MTLPSGVTEELRVEFLAKEQLVAQRQVIARFVSAAGVALCHDPRWLGVFSAALGHTPFCLTASRGEELAGILPLALVRSVLFGRFLVGLPYLNTGGVVTNDAACALRLIDRAVEVADELDVKFLELRHETECVHPRLSRAVTNKVHMRLPLPNSVDELWSAIKAKVRNQIRKGESHELTVHWGQEELLGEFYQVFSRNMRDLGTPVYSRRLFQQILTVFSREAELCVVRLAGRPVAGALLLHGNGTTEVPSASSLAEYNGTNANMLMYWHLLRRTIERGQRTFDFGRSSEDSGTFRFKKQWGAHPEPATWQHYVRQGQANQMRPDSGKYDRMIRIWQRLPVPLTRQIGPLIARGIP